MQLVTEAASALSRTLLSPVRHAVSSLCVVRAGVALIATLAIPALALPPDIANRSYVQIPYQFTFSNQITGASSSSYVAPTAVAAGTEFALVGSGNPRRSASLTISSAPPFLAVPSATYTANPVIVTDPPWTGAPSQARNINPPTNPQGVERFGTSLDMHGNRVAVGSPEVFTWSAGTCGISCGGVIVFEEPTDNGRVHLYLYNGTTFAPERIIEYGGLQERFGAAVSLDAAYLLVGRPGADPGAADLFNPNTGSLITTFTSPSAHDGFGETVVLAGDLAIVGARTQSTVYVYRRDVAGTWSAAGVLSSPGAGSEFGTSIAADGERILVGAPGIDRAYVFEDDGDGDWPVAAELAGGDGSRFGTAVALVGDTAFVSAPTVLYAGMRTGLVARHERASDGTWPFVTHKNSRQPTNGEGFGNAIAASTTMLTVLENGLSSRPSEQSVFTAPPAPGC